jgi:hypothetical protein
LFFGCLLLFLAALSAPVQAQPRPSYAPSSTHIYPAGGQRGTIVSVLVGTECAPPATRFSIVGAGISAGDTLGSLVHDVGDPSPRRAPTETPITYPREWQSQITIAADATLGGVFWQLHCAQGGTASRPFVIGDLPEYLEEESNSLATRAERITLPVTVNGRINGERDIDYFRFSATAGQIVTCEMIARRLGSQLDPLMQLLDDNGHPVRCDETHVGNDPVLVMRAPKTIDYLLRIANVTKHGNPANVYRVNVTTKPFVRSAFPAGGRTGQTESIELFALTGDGATQSIVAKVTFPAAAGSFRYQSSDFSGTIQLVSDDVDHRLDDQPNETRAAATMLDLPRAVDGRIDHARDVDWFSFSAEPDTAYSLVCQPFPAWDASLPTLLLVDETGKELARHRSVEAEDGVARIEWKSSAAGRCFVRVRDQQFGVAGGQDFVYRLTVRKAVPDFELRLASDNLDVMPGETTVVEVKIVRRGGFLGPVQLRFRDLPHGIEMEAAKVNAKAKSAKIKLNVARGIPLSSRLVELVGQAKIAGKTVQRVALADHSGVDSQGLAMGPARLPRLQLTVRNPPLFRLYCAEAYQYAHRGSIYPYLMEIERLNGFKGEIVLQIGDRQNRDLDGIEMIETVIAAGETTAMLPIYLPETMHINIQSQSQLYSQGYVLFTDHQGKRQSQLILSEKRNMLRTLPPVVKLLAKEQILAATVGETVQCHLQLERTSNFPGPMRLELLDGKSGLPIRVEPLTIAAHATEVAVPVQVLDGCAAGMIELTFRATGSMSETTQAVTEVKVRLEVAAP